MWQLEVDKLFFITETNQIYLRCKAARTEEGYNMFQQSSTSGCASAALLTTHERDEEQPRDRWSPKTTWPSQLMSHTQTHTREQNSPCLVPASHQMAHLLRPSAQRDAGRVVPTDRRPNSPHAPWQAGVVTAPLVEDQMLITASSRRPAATHPPRKDCLSLG